ncbi:hypothetical protein FFF34_003700 [Inquilinus sp. KBS0705]|nr:hypothetical protein FFF34_003700 [Inquilinus sp. KBS0705]
MKKILLGMLVSGFMLAASVTQTKAQVNVSLNIGTWNPPAEYADVDYYYLPDVDSYYYVPTHQYVYLNGGTWVFRRELPPRYSSYNISNGYKVAVNRPRAYRYYNYDRAHYGRYRGNYDRQIIVRDHYKTRVINHTRVVNRTHYVNRPNRVVNRTHYVNRPAHHNTRVVSRSRVINRPAHGNTRVVSHTRVVNRPGGHGDNGHKGRH